MLLPGCGQDAADSSPDQHEESATTNTDPTKTASIEGNTHSEAPADNSSGRNVDPEKFEQAKRYFAIVTDPSATPDQWEEAQTGLMTMGSDAVPLLEEKLRSSDRPAREIASSMFAFVGPEASAAIDTLKQGLNDDSNFVRANCAVTLAQMPKHADSAMPIFAELINASDPDLRQMAARNLAQYGKQASSILPSLTKALEQDDAEVVRPVVELLGRIGPPALSALPKLQQIAHETTEDEPLRDAAVKAVEQIESKLP